MTKFVVQITNWKTSSLELLYFNNLRKANLIAMTRWLKIPLEDKEHTTICTGVITPEMCLLDSKCDDEEWYETFYTTYHSNSKYLKLGKR